MELIIKLNPKYQHIRSNILMMKEPPSAAEAYRLLMQEQTHQELSKTTMYKDQETPIVCRIEKRKFTNRGRMYKTRVVISVIIVRCMGIAWIGVGKFMVTQKITSLIHGKRMGPTRLTQLMQVHKMKGKVLNPN